MKISYEIEDLLEKIEGAKAQKLKKQQKLERLNKSKRRSIDMNSISLLKSGSMISKYPSTSRLHEKALMLKSSQVSWYSKKKLLYPEVDFEKLNQDQAEVIKTYIEEIKRLDRDLNKKRIIRPTNTIEIKPYNLES